MFSFFAFGLCFLLYHLVLAHVYVDTICVHSLCIGSIALMMLRCSNETLANKI